ncbi:MAG: aldehyde dehydrogenase [Pseudomonadota bacterium]
MQPKSNLATYRLYIGGEWIDPASGAWFESDDPYQGAPWALIPRGDARDAERAVAAARAAFTAGEWPTCSPTARGAHLRRLGDLVSQEAEALARIECRDIGKRLVEVVAQMRIIPQWFYYYGGLADKIEGAVTPIERPDIFNYTVYEPLGVVVAITPWNSPLWLLSWKLAPALAAGNTVVIKPSEHASASTLEFMKLVEKSGLPPGVVNTVTGFGHEIGEPLIAHPSVAKVAFTGSEATGQKVYELAARGMKRVTLELGGKSPQIVFEDADLDAAVDGVIGGIFASNGQSCVAGSRLFLHEGIYDRFMDKLVAAASALRLGNPLDDNTQIGPIATRPQYEKVLRYIQMARDEGAKCVLGGRPAARPECGRGWFVEPTIFTGVTNDMRIAREEIFGPVLSVMRFDDEAKVTAAANDSDYGLAAGIWTADMKRALALTRKLEAGTVYVNNYRGVSYASPAGGYKRSGIGRENGPETIKDYMQVKSVWIGTG